MTKILLALAIFAAQPINAQLRSLCSSPTAEFCVNVWSWDFRYSVLDVMNDVTYWRLDGTTEVETVGSGWETNASVLALYFRPPSRDNLHVLIYQHLPTVGFYTIATTGEGPFYAIERDPIIDDLERVTFGDGGGCLVVECHPRSVPEPGTFVLLASGIVALAWERRRSNLARRGGSQPEEA